MTEFKFISKAMLGVNKFKLRSGIPGVSNTENVINIGTTTKGEEDEIEKRVMNMTVSQKAAYFKSQMVVNEGAMNEAKVARQCSDL